MFCPVCGNEVEFKNNGFSFEEVIEGSTMCNNCESIIKYEYDKVLNRLKIKIEDIILEQIE